MSETVVKFEHVSMEFPGVLANDDVSLEIKKGEVFALVGENGAGKSTLMNILYGINTPTNGEVYVKGRRIEHFSPKAAIERGVGMVHQHFMLVPSFTVAQNIVLSREPRRLGVFFDNAGAERETRGLVEEYGLEVDPAATVRDISVGLQQRVEILKTLYRGADILILDEPTAVLTPQETEKLFDVMREMKRDGKSVVIITHKLHEVLSVSDRVAILRKGEYIDTVDTADTTELSLTEMMVGKKVSLDIDRPTPKNLTKRLVVENLSCFNKEGVQVLKDISFDVNGGEIFGIAGISGSGQKELLEAIAGLQHVTPASRITYFDPKQNDTAESLVGKSPRKIKELGVALSFVPEDRLGMGLVGSMGMTENMMLKSYETGHSFFTERRAPRDLAENIREDLGVVTPGINTPVRKLSGGNVQKVLVGREISASPTVLMTAYAVRGLDIHTSYTIYHLLNEQKEKGVAVIYVGEDLDVLVALCDRILVLCGGEVSGIVDGRKTTKEEVGLMMVKKHA